jgi:hypothetical protein
MKRVFLFALATVFTVVVSHAQAGYEKSIDAGYLSGVGKYKNNTVSFSMINGFRFNNTLFFGIGVGIGYSNALYEIYTNDFKGDIVEKESRGSTALIPFYANIKVNLSKDKISPFLSLNVGYTFKAAGDPYCKPGSMLQPNFGINCKVTEKTDVYFLVGFNIQRFDYKYIWFVGKDATKWINRMESDKFRSIDLRVGIKF